MRGWGNGPSVRLPDLTIDWEFETHTILLRKARKEVWWAGEDLRRVQRREPKLSVPRKD
jgi:hypothetical protein